MTLVESTVRASASLDRTLCLGSIFHIFDCFGLFGVGAQHWRVSGKGDAGIAMALPDSVRRTVYVIALPWIAFTMVVYLFAFAGGFVQTWGRDYTVTLNHFRTAFSLEWGQFGLVWAGTAWNSLFTTLKLAGISAPITAALGLLIAWLLARNEFKG